jgi:nodulation protein E
MTRVAVTGLGCVSGLGANLSEAWENALAGVTGIGPHVVTVSEDIETTTLAAAVKEDPTQRLSSRFGRKSIMAVDRFSNFGAAATAEALEDAGIELGSAQLQRASIVYGACSGGVHSIESAYARMFIDRAGPHPLTIPRFMTSAPTSHLSILFGVQGLCLTIATACASSAHAIAEGMHLIRAGRAETVIVGGTDASLTYASLQSWKALQAVSQTACRPFSLGRDGTVIGEGAATLVLESENSAHRRGARIHCLLVGAGATSDASHMTQPNAESAARAVMEAYADAGLDVGEPALISAHGTGTVLNDHCETKVLHSIYSDGLFNHRVIATKSGHGHMLGASGAMEFILGIKALNTATAPPILSFVEGDPNCQLPLVLKPEPISYRTLVSNSFAFGGLNSVLIAQRV